MNLGRTFAWLSLFLAFSLFALGCDSNNGGGDDNDGGNNDGGNGDAGDDDGGEDAGDDASVEPTIVDVVDVYSDALCALTDALCDTGYDEDTYYVFRVGSANGHCKESAASFLTDRNFQFNDLQRLLDSGAVTVDAAALDACLATMVSDCTYSPNLALPCLDLFEGTVDDGDDCSRSEECAGDAYCDTTGGFACPGECTARKDLGEICNQSVECSKGEFDAAICEGTCVGVNVTVGGQQGQDCGGTEGEDPSTLDWPFCGKGYYCESGKGGGSCNGFSVAEGVCNSPIGCEPGYICEGTDGPDRCIELTYGHENDDCGGETDPPCDAYERLTCVEGSCEDAGAGTAGLPCSVGIEACAPGFYCEPNGEDDDTCEALKGDGEDCASGDECQSDQCDVETGCRGAYCAYAGQEPPI